MAGRRRSRPARSSHTAARVPSDTGGRRSGTEAEMIMQQQQTALPQTMPASSAAPPAPVPAAAAAPIRCEGEKKAPPINSEVYKELWYACAGPLVSLPPAGSLVVHFPEGHSEQVKQAMLELECEIRRRCP